MSRLFVAIPLPDDVITELARIQPQAVSGLRLVPAEQMHVTLHFIGEADINATCQALTAVKGNAFELKIGRVGKFPQHGKPSVLWAGIEVSPALQDLYCSVGEALRAIDFAAETRPYSPHITLARCGPRVPFDIVADFFESHQDFELSPFQVTEFRLYSSTKIDDGQVYRCEGMYPLI